MKGGVHYDDFSGSMGGHGSGVFSNKCFSVLHGTRLRHLFSFSLSLIAVPVTIPYVWFAEP